MPGRAESGGKAGIEDEVLLPIWPRLRSDSAPLVIFDSADLRIQFCKLFTQHPVTTLAICV